MGGVSHGCIVEYDTMYLWHATTIMDRYVAKHADLINHPQEARQFISAVRYVLPYADYKILIPKLSQQLKETWSVLEKYGITRT